MLPFNISYSAWDLYKKSQLQFFYQYIVKPEKTNKGMQVYGDAGNVVHNAIEFWIKHKEDTFNEQWDNYNIDEQTGIRGAKLDKAEYKHMYDTAISYLKNVECLSMLPEVKIEQKIFGENFKGFLDLVINEKNSIILDWKTNSTCNEQMHKGQRLFYSWLMWRYNKIIPYTMWFYLRQKKFFNDNFSEAEIEVFDLDMQNFVVELKEKGNDISKYEIGNYKNPFNQYYDLCKAEEERRQQDNEINLYLKIKGNFVYVEGAPTKLLEGFDYATKFDLPNKFWMQKNCKNQFNVADVGTIHLFNRKFKYFPIGLIDKFHQICSDYRNFYKVNITLDIQDFRDQEIMDSNIMIGRYFNLDYGLRDYQLKAYNKFLEKGNGIIQIPTGGGKTLTAAFIIRELDTRTLWIIDRKELLQQTKKELEKLLGVEIGEISGDKFDIRNITISTIQSLNSTKMNNNVFNSFFYNTNFVIVDEFHKSAAESYQKVFAKLPNTKYRLGLTATPQRDDGKDPILFSILGDVIYKIGVQELINKGYLVKPKIEFLKVKNVGVEKTYQEDYKNNVVQLKMRNDVIKYIAMCSYTKKTLILTKLIEHGKLLNDYISNSKYLHGSLAKDKREQIMKDFREAKSGVLIMTLSIGAEGLDIPDLDIIINAAGNKGDVKSVQVLGRVLRTFKDKKECYYYDFVDCGPYTRQHSLKRMMAFKEQGHEVDLI